jgi:uncharacterized protein with LGFP repeats
LKDDGGYQTFQGGRVVFSAASGAHALSGQILNTWLSIGADNSIVGYPTSSVVTQSTGSYQNFQGGGVMTSGAGSYYAFGSFFSVWVDQGAGNGVLGYPTSNPTGGLKDDGGYQTYQGGRVYFSPATDSHYIYGDIMNQWNALGAQNGSLGYPTSNPVPYGSGFVQYFQGGSLLSEN